MGEGRPVAPIRVARAMHLGAVLDQIGAEGKGPMPATRPPGPTGPGGPDWPLPRDRGERP
ncbi:hypothetical protein EV659_10758 [Rhodothalassium salexigens DSM 2132]|uniref:Uncharacterized protein n=1 Tax=Rhodothalassium salexigens DSM 2132 TaxID=1188247 RepID=A0A4R2PG00_RHOSA|nr:hypothetical protein [Rhodothalassium salexigens DSM 2132]TCP33448.1 hypothetical protein EV659_10758 [Rhodothalassium salexigens DSM 2132]